MKRFLQIAILAGVIGAIIGASITIAASNGGNGSQASNSSRGGDRQEYRHGPHLFGHRAVLKSAAAKLGVSATQLRDALRKAEEQLGPPKPPQTMDPNALRQAMQQRCTQVTDAVGKALGKSGDDVRSAFKSAALERVDKAKSAGRLTDAQANRIKSRINSESCVLGLGLRAGCGPGGHMGPPPMGFRRGGSQTAPQSGFAPTEAPIPA